jgi:hypothetical protein
MLIEPHYYSPNGHIFFDKISALKSKQSFKFYYYDDVWSSCDWTKEPNESLEYYYKEQAQRIRDEYDYVILCYSGGFDSTNILETFHYNGIKLDQLAIVGPFKQDSHSGSDENHNGEIYLNAFPYIKELGLESIVKLYDNTEIYGTPEKLSLFQTGEQWIENIGLRLSPHNWFWKDLENYIVPKEYQDKKVAILFGRDKPHLIYENGIPGFCFRDIPVCDYGNVNKRNKNIDRISFYWDPNYTNILIKQVHMLYRAYPPNYTDWRPVEDGLPHKQLYNSDKIVYNLKKPLLYKSPKTKTLILAKRDNFLVSHQSSKLYDFYNMGINKLMREVDFNVFSRAVKSKFYRIK